MVKRTRWVQYEVPLYVRVEIDDEYEDDEVTQAVLAIPPLDPVFRPAYEGIELARDHRGHFLVYDGDPRSEMARVDDRLAERAITLAEYRLGWPGRDEWEEGDDPRRVIGLYDDPETADPDEDDGDDLEWAPLR